MIDLAANASRYFQQGVTLAQDELPPLADAVADGARLVVDALLRGGRVLSCGDGPGAALAQYFTTLLQDQFERQRPALPGIALNADGILLGAIAGRFDFDELFARQVRALGQDGDVLLVIASEDDREPLIAAVQSARDQRMTVIAVTCGEPGRLGRLLAGNDIEIRLSQPVSACARELQLVILHALCELIDTQLLGNEQPMTTKEETP